ncbi:tetratricopeptide repeat protein [Winogradskyella sp.]|uniref:tetratricopeptide repeat-containing sensor histidine kinase n=1 Tax=Winogradskyella sp. TaxID=1883156 RepID=UPI00351311B0
MKLIPSILILFLSLVSSGQRGDIEKTLGKIESAPDFSLEKFENIIRLGESYRPYPFSTELEENGMPKAYLRYAQEALNWASKEGTKQQAFKAKRFLFDYYCYDKDVSNLIILGGEMVKNNSFANNQDKHFVYLKLSEVYKELGLLKEYIELTPELYEVARHLKLRSSHAHEEYNHIALAYYKMKDYKRARKYFAKSISFLKSENRPFAESSVSNNMGLAFAKENEKDSARLYFERALNILKYSSAKKEGFGNESYKNHFQNIIEANIAYLDVSNGEYKEAIKAIEKELISAQVEREYGTQLQAYNKLANIYYLKQEYNKSLEYLKKAESENLGRFDNNVKLDNLNTKAKVLLALGKQNESELVFKRKKELQDSIASVETKKTAKVASIFYEVQKKDLEIKNQQASIALLDSKNKAKQQLLFIVVFGLLLLFGSIILIRSRNNAKRNQKLQESFSQGLINAQEKERNRLAIDLHDGVGQQLMMLLRKSRNKNNQEIENLAASTLSNLRAISRNLHPATIKQLGFTVAARELVNKVDEDIDTLLTADIQNIDDVLDSNKKLHLYRILQELLNNLVKHSNAKSAEISIFKTQEHIKFEYKDNGIGFDLNEKYKSSNSLGINSIKERCKILNASLLIKSRISHGTEILITMPIV